MSSTILFFTFLVSILFIVGFQKYFISKGFVDSINKRSSHTKIATRSGGAAIASTIFIISFYNYFIGNTIYDYSIIVPLGLLTVVGLYDDLFNIDFKLKFLFQIIAAKIIIDNGFLIDNFHGVFGVFELNRIVAQLITIFIITAIINAINFIDGIDGLAITIVSLFIFLFESFSIVQTPLYNLSLILLTSIMPLYYFNFKKNNKVFLGDSGSLFLGTISSIYIIHILTNDYIIKENFDLHKILFVISIFVYPIADIIRIFFIRIISGKSPFIADKNHIHHIILAKLKSHHLTVIIIFLLSLTVTIITQLIF